MAEKSESEELVDQLKETMKTNRVVSAQLPERKKAQRLYFTVRADINERFEDLKRAIGYDTNSRVFEYLVDLAHSCSVLATSEKDKGSLIQEIRSLKASNESLVETIKILGKPLEKKRKVVEAKAKKSPDGRSKHAGPVTPDERRIVEVWKKTFNQNPSHIHWPVITRRLRVLVEGGMTYARMEELIKASVGDAFVMQKLQEGKPLYPNALLSDGMLNTLIALADKKKAGGDETAIVQGQRLEAAKRRTLNRLWHLIPETDKKSIREEVNLCKSEKMLDEIATRVRSKAIF